MDHTVLTLLLITLLSLLECFAFSIYTGIARRKYHVAPPAMSGHLAVESAIRIHYNTLEQLILFLPTLWIFAFLVSMNWANILGGIWIIGRLLYAIGYAMAPLKRYPGFALTILPLMIMMGGSIYVIVMQLVR